MSSDTKYYDLLGCSKDSTQDQIRKAYKKKAMKFHPDRPENHGNSEIEEKFKDITAAYEVLKDEEKRDIYDKYGEEGLKGENNFGGGDFGGIFRSFFGGGGGFGFGDHQRKRGPRKGRDFPRNLEVSLEDLYNGAKKKVKITRRRICKVCKGIGASKKDAIVDCEECDGKGKVIRIHQISSSFVQQMTSVCRKCQGKGKIINKKYLCKECNGKKVVLDEKLLEIDIDPGMVSGQKIVFAGEADEAPNVIPGDIIFYLKEKQHSEFVRKNNDLYMNKKINLLESLTGVKFNIKHLDGRNVVVHSKHGLVIKPGDTLMVHDEGFPNYGEIFNKGNLYIKFEIEFPDKVSKKFVNQLEKILPKKSSMSKDIEADDEYELEEPLYSRSKKRRNTSEAYNSDSEDEGGNGNEGVQCHTQ